MTNRELDNAIALMQAYKDGKTIQMYDDIEQRWFDLREPGWDFGSFIYRVKPDEPKPHYRPFKSVDEVLEAIREHGSWVRKSTSQWLIIGIDSEGVYLRDHYSLFANLKEYSFTDGTPFGIKED